MIEKNEKINTEEQKAPAGFEPTISCLLDRHFNQLSHGAERFQRALAIILINNQIERSQICS